MGGDDFAVVGESRDSLTRRASAIALLVDGLQSSSSSCIFLIDDGFRRRFGTRRETVGWSRC